MKCRFNLVIALSGLLFPAGLYAQLLPPEQRAIPIDGYSALVNGRVITLGEVQAMSEPMKQQILNRGGASKEDLKAAMDEADRRALENLIDRALILEEAIEDELFIPDKMVDDRIRTMIEERFQNDRAILLETLEKERMSLTEWKEDLREQLTIMIMRRREVNDRISVMPRDVRASYDAQMDVYRIPAESHIRMRRFRQCGTGKFRRQQSGTGRRLGMDVRERPPQRIGCSRCINRSRAGKPGNRGRWHLLHYDHRGQTPGGCRSVYGCQPEHSGPNGAGAAAAALPGLDGTTA